MNDDSIPVGKWTKYNSRGKPQIKAKYKIQNGSWLCHGRVKEYFPSGNIWKTYKASYGKIVGYQVTYDDSSRKVSCLHFDRGTLPNGRAIYYYPNGKIKEEGTYGDRAAICSLDSIAKKITILDSVPSYYSSKVGVWKEYYNNGQLRSYGEYLRCIKYDNYIPNYGNGKGPLKETTKVKIPVYIKNGVWTYCDSAGSPKETEEFVNGFSQGRKIIN